VVCGKNPTDAMYKKLLKSVQSLLKIFKIKLVTFFSETHLCCMCITSSALCNNIVSK